jgi:hypothetical protein
MRHSFAFLVLLGIAITPQAAFAQETSTPATENDGRHDFDFFIGTWKIANRRLKSDSENDWIEFSSITVDRSFIDGLGNMDEMTLPKNYRGISLRFFDPIKKEWSIYWAKSPTGVLELPPVVGHFVGGVGKFYSDDVDAHNKPVKIRYTWTHPSADQAFWNMAFSYDGGATWKVIWTMEMTRTKSAGSE